MKVRKILSLGLSVIMVLALLPLAGLTRVTSALTYLDPNNVTEWTYSENANGDGIKISGCTYATANLVIPSEIDGKPVTTVTGGASASGFKTASAITTITVPDSVTELISYAFSGLSYLTTVNLGNNVTKIDTGVFKGCRKLTTITIGDSVTTIGTSAFENCSVLATVTIGTGLASIGNKAFYNCAKLTDLYFAGARPRIIPTTAMYTPFNQGSTAITLHYSTANASTWAPNGETTWTICNVARKIVNDYNPVPLTPNYDVTVNAANAVITADGSTITSGSAVTVDEGEGTIITVTPNVGNVITGDATLTPSDAATIESVTNIANGGKQYTLTDVTQDCALTVTTTPLTYTVTASTSLVNGTIAPASATVNHGSNLTFTATPAANYALTSASVSPAGSATCQVSGNNINVNGVTADCIVSAVFSPINYNVNATVTGGNGSISPASTTANVESSATVTATPNEGYQIADYTLTPATAATVALNGNVFTLTNVTAACTLDVTFEVLPDPTYTDANGHVFTYHIEGTSAVITEIAATGDVTVPAQLGGYNVTELGMNTSPNYSVSVFGFSPNVSSIELPATLTKINAGALSCCRDLDSVVIPQGVTTIGANAFSQCSSLTSIDIPASVVTINNYAFYYCSKLKAANFKGEKPATAGDYIFSAVSSDFTVFYTEAYAANWTQYGATTWNGYPILPTPKLEISTLGAAARLDRSAIRFGASFSFEQLQGLDIGDEVRYGFKVAPIVNDALYNEQTSVGVVITWTEEMKAATTTEALAQLMRDAGAKVWGYDDTSLTFALILNGPAGTTFETISFAFVGYAELNNTPLEGERMANSIQGLIEGNTSVYYQES